MPEAFHCSVFSASPYASVTSVNFTYDMHHNLLSPTRSTPAVEGPEQLQALQAEAPDSDQIPVTAMDLGARMEHAEVQDLSPLAAGADHLPATITPGVAF